MADSACMVGRSLWVRTLSVAAAGILLLGTVQAQGFRFKTAKEKQQFWVLQDQILEITETITKLQQVRDKSSDDLESLKVLRRRLTKTSQAAMALVVPKAKLRSKQQPMRGRPLSAKEEKIRQRADLKARVVFWKTGTKAFTENDNSVRFEGLMLLDHPSLEAFPDHRFYLAKIQVLPDIAPAEVAKNAPRWIRDIYQLAVFDCRAQKILIRPGFSPWDAVGPILESGVVCAPSKAIAEKISLARTVLLRASMGASVFRRIDSKGLTQEEIDKRFGLGVWARNHVVDPHGYLETEKEGMLLSWRLHSDDFGMPQRLLFEWMRFDRKGGHWLGRATKAGPFFDSRTRLDNPKVERAVMKFAHELLGQ